MDLVEFVNSFTDSRHKLLSLTEILVLPRTYTRVLSRIEISSSRIQYLIHEVRQLVWSLVGYVRVLFVVFFVE